MQKTDRHEKPHLTAAAIGAAFTVGAFSAAGAAPLYEEPRHLSAQVSFSRS
jgi:hypothetical protein